MLTTCEFFRVQGLILESGKNNCGLLSYSLKGKTLTKFYNQDGQVQKMWEIVFGVG